MQMKYNTALRFWRAYIRMANGGNAHVNMPNPAIDFTARAYAGDFDEMSDSDYEGRLEDTEALISFWDGSRQETAGNILLNAMERTELSDYIIEKIAGILADASVRTDYYTEEEEAAEHLVIVVDEADKMLEPAIASGGTDVARRVQNELLKLMDGGTLTFVSDNNNDKSRKITVDCSGVSVVLCGSFETMIQTKMEASSGGIGFLQSEKKKAGFPNTIRTAWMRKGTVFPSISGRFWHILQPIFGAYKGHFSPTFSPFLYQMHFGQYWAKMPKICTALCPFFKAGKEGYHRTGYPIFLELILEMYLRKTEKKLYMAG